MYRDLVEDTTTAIVVVEMKGRRIVYANKAFRALFPSSGTDAFLLSQEEADSLSPSSFSLYRKKVGNLPVAIKAKAVTWNREACYVLHVTEETNGCTTQLLDLIPMGIVIYELSGETLRKVYANEGYYRMLRDTRENRQANGNATPLECVHKDDKTGILATITRLRNGKDEESVDFRMYCGDCIFRWFRLVASVAKRDQGKMTLYCGFSNIDDAITAREELKKTNKEISKQYAQELAQRKMLEKDSMIVVQFNVTQDKLISSRVTQSIVQKFESGAKGTSIRPDIAANIPTEEERRIAADFFDVRKAASRYQKGIREFSAVYRRRLGDGRLYWLLSICRLAKDEESGDLISYTFLRNIDVERKRALVAESMIDDETDFVILLNVISQSALLLRLKECHRQKGRKIGEEFPITKVPSTYLMGLVNEEDKPEVSRFFIMDSLIARLKEKPVVTLTCRCRSNEGVVQRKKLKAFYLDSIHEDIVISGRDITDIYQEEQEQKSILEKALDEAKSANRAKSEFLSRMSHDLRTPMNVIIGLTTMAKESSSSSSPEMREMLSNISDSANYLLSLINDCLDLEKITSRKFDLHPSPCLYSEFFHGIKSIIGPLCEVKRITFVLTNPQNGGHPVLADKMRLQQILYNLLSNAVKYTPVGGKIEFIVQDLFILDGYDTFLCIVSDNGTGMSGEFQKHMFEPFSQEENSITPEYQGSGLGLSIVKQLVDLMGGTIEVKSKIGEGTTFTLRFRFPIAEIPKETIAVPPPSFPIKLKGKRILLAEDHPLNALIAVKLLEKEGMEVATAANGKIALDTFALSPNRYFDAVLMDIRMPVMNGLESVRAIRSLDREDAKTVPIIAMTANAFDSDVEESLEAGMDAHLSKPIEPDKLYETLSLCMAKASSSRKENRTEP